MDKTRIARLRKMEDDFNLVREVIDALQDAVEDYDAVQRRIKRLTEYQESGEWLKDFEADERGEFPKDMPRGVLSEDGLDNLLSDIASVRARIAALVEEPDDENWETKYQEYDPLVDSPESIPEKPGSLIVVLRYMSSCPETWNLNLREFEGQDVLFVGDTKNLRQRIVGNHFRSNSALSSLRISLGCLHGMLQIPRDKTPDGVHFKFSSRDEKWLTKWMKENLLVYYTESPYYDRITKLNLLSLNPPLNLENTSADIAEFRTKLSVLRSQHYDGTEREKAKRKDTVMRLPIAGKDLPASIHEAVAEMSERIPDKLDVAFVDGEICRTRGEGLPVILFFGFLDSETWSKRLSITICSFVFKTRKKMAEFLASEEGSVFKENDDKKSVTWNTPANDPKVADSVVAILKNYLGVKETTKLIVKVKMDVMRY